MAGGGRGTVTGSGNLDRVAAPHREAFLRHLDEAFRRYGYAEGLPERLRAAVRATPRHRFVHRFRAGADGPLQDFDADPVGLLPLVYRGQPLTPVDGAGAPLPSTNSEAAYMLWLVARLGVEPGQRVLEIGCGSGWLLAVMAHLAGPGGRTTGVEIIPDLADQARADLAGLGCADAAVLTGDAARADPGRSVRPGDRHGRHLGHPGRAVRLRGRRRPSPRPPAPAPERGLRGDAAGG